MTKTKKPSPRARKRNPNDTTFRNINALKKRVAKLEQWCDALTQDVHLLFMDAGRTMHEAVQPKRKNKGR